ncbi:lytic murein transglycosylase [Vibrio sp. SS-MA-C1-2]|uniref:lytic murein transglycosylase n=1 Tax=Vibrio sp. SS-MA-C1-2 TaxID=2908646 RepID=UPI001F416FF1|nr:lytic murein transglycosylase [Vibrio sp. SS-MA-C1-2]UJF19938.1 lytic murein transglycosylase [Vibrio sp. SS-MA-C1-2]
MRIKKIALVLSVGFSFLLTPTVSIATTFEQYVSELKKEALDKGYSNILVNQAFANLTYKEKVVKADRNQPEKRLTLQEYIPKAVPAWKIKQANQLYQQNYQVLQEIGKEYGVQPRFIVALWGVESNFGRLMGNHNVFQALTTLAYEGRREAFFRSEIFSALDIVQQKHISVEKIKGSWAGAMGQNQFMPSSFLNYAVDGDNDGKMDIWYNKADVFASTANYLKQVGWDDKYIWGRQVIVPERLNHLKNETKKLVEWQYLGVRRSNKMVLPKADIEARLIQPDGGNGVSYLVYGNYEALLRWNRSHYFALAVSNLADNIK